MLKEKFLISLISVLVTLGVVFSINNFSLTGNVVAPANDIAAEGGIGYHSDVCVQTRQAGETEWHLIQCKHNFFSEAGKNITRDLLAGQSLTGLTNVTVIALGNGTGANATNLNMVNGTYLGGINNPILDCGLGPSSGTMTYQQNNNNCLTTGCSGNWTITKTFTNTCGANSLNQTGLYNASSPGVNQILNSSYFAGNNFTVATLQTNDQINITWFIWVS